MMPSTFQRPKSGGGEQTTYSLRKDFSFCNKISQAPERATRDAESLDAVVTSHCAPFINNNTASASSAETMFSRTPPPPARFDG